MQQKVRNQFSYVICTWEYSFVFFRGQQVEGGIGGVREKIHGHEGGVGETSGNRSGKKYEG